MSYVLRDLTIFASCAIFER